MQGWLSSQIFYTDFLHIFSSLSCSHVPALLRGETKRSVNRNFDVTFHISTVLQNTHCTIHCTQRKHRAGTLPFTFNVLLAPYCTLAHGIHIVHSKSTDLGRYPSHYPLDLFLSHLHLHLPCSARFAKSTQKEKKKFKHQHHSKAFSDLLYKLGNIQIGLYFRL